MLTEAQLSQYQREGYLVLNEYIDEEHIDALRNEALSIVDDFDEHSTRSFFSTKNEAAARNNYFLSSGDKIRCFFEEDAFNQDGELNQDKSLSINKIGHALHKYNPVFNQFCQRPDISGIAKALGQKKPEIRQSMYIFKQPRIGGVVRWHQDATYFLTRPSSVITFWIAIEDANAKNGCLMVKPQTGDFPLREQFKRFSDDTTQLEQLLSVEWPLEKEAIPLEVKKGSLIVFNGQLPHYSSANTSSKSRHAVTLHLTCAETQYDPHNWLQADPLAIG